MYRRRRALGNWFRHSRARRSRPCSPRSSSPSFLPQTSRGSWCRSPLLPAVGGYWAWDFLRPGISRSASAPSRRGWGLTIFGPTYSCSRDSLCSISSRQSSSCASRRRDMTTETSHPQRAHAQEKSDGLFTHIINILRLTIKELRSIRADPMMLVLVAYTFSVAVYTVATGASTEAKDLTVGVVDED